MRKQLLNVVMWVLLSVAWGHAQSESEIYGVVVGISKYAQSASNLSYSHKDAADMYNLLRLHTPASRLKLLTDENATRANIIKAAEELFSRAKPEDVVIFFFSGHGNHGLFLTHDREMRFTELRSVFQKTKAKRKIILADSCLSGTLRTSGPAAKTNADLGDGVMLFLSSRSNQLSFEDSFLQNGYFTWYLMAGLRGGADANLDRIITARELFDFVNPRVRSENNGRQVPVMWGRFDDNMVILNWK